MKIALIILLGISVNLFAANKRCGVGSLLFGKSKKSVWQFSEVVTNHTCGGGSSIAYGTSGCKHDGKFILNESELHFANINHEDILIEMAQGNGETIETFAQVLGCGAQDVENFKQHMKQNFPTIYSDDPNEMLIRVKENIYSSPHLVSCKTLS